MWVSDYMGIEVSQLHYQQLMGLADFLTWKNSNKMQSHSARYLVTTNPKKESSRAPNLCHPEVFHLNYSCTHRIS